MIQQFQIILWEVEPFSKTSRMTVPKKKRIPIANRYFKITPESQIAINSAPLTQPSHKFKLQQSFWKSNSSNAFFYWIKPPFPLNQIWVWRSQYWILILQSLCSLAATRGIAIEECILGKCIYRQVMMYNQQGVHIPTFTASCNTHSFWHFSVSKWPL